MDKVDRKILSILQQDAETPIHAIADAVNLSPTPCWRRIQKLKESGIIRKQVALCDAAKLNLGVTAFISIKTSQHTQAWLDNFAREVVDIPEVIEFYRMSGNVDYLIRVVVPDIASYDAVYRKLIRIADLFDVSSSFSMEQIKYTTALPLDYAE
ncbi:Lrp/AsnC family transcriptional regulator [Allopusillimonas soli]|uniref:Lrp/AsnC family transcriptional regulator n=1 Tax=Allopusillimonas soli TaxID=659016 RepID=A0A853FF10_9BURK|nr:Lrp/AsnC family transcriptional regulator [Allopusillimonas soli]NYT38272.1 Lrp/AsnC family transcriptional regulator [Allopusillimonas soli]TEA72152.1 Lrp/AsnC family transcriptional regulator [Allopusillimonas soli]